MKKSLLILTLAVAMMATAAVAGDEGAWFDMANCSMCVHMSSEPGFMENVGWENHVLDNGWMTVTVVKESYATQFASVREKMMATGEKLMGGEPMHLCGFCTNYMDLMGSGKVHSQEFDTIGGKVSLVTSDDPEVALKLQKHAKKSIKEMKAMMAGESHAEKAMD